MIFVLDRTSLTLVSTYGQEGTSAGSFNGMHSINADSAGNVYVSEIKHGRVQKFSYQGLVEVPQYAHRDLHTGTPQEQASTRYTVADGFFMLLLHVGCTPEMPVELCSMDSFSW